MMLQLLKRKFELYWDTAWYLSIYDQTIQFKGRQKDKLRITSKDVGDGLQDDGVCDRGYTYYFIYQNDEMPDSKHYLCDTRERVIWIIKHLNKEWINVYMDNLHNIIKLYRA